MIISKIYEFTLDDGTTITTSQSNLSNVNIIDIRERYSLRADANKILTNNIITTYHIFVDDVTGWYEIDAPITDNVD